MLRLIRLLLLSTFALSLAGAADAKGCRDAHGKFTACPAAAAAPAPAPAATSKAATCRDAKGKFVKCSAAAAADTAAAVKAGNTASPPSPVTPHPAATTANAGRSLGPAAAGTSAVASGPQCKKGKRCGNSCISVKDVCHK